MNSIPRPLSRVLAVAAILALTASCGGTAQPTVQAPVATAAAPAQPAATQAAVAPQATATTQGQILAHKAGAAHASQPKRLEAVVELDMYDHYFASVDGAKNPTLTLPAGKTVGLHVHNEGAVMHEFMIGRTLNAKKDGYDKSLFDTVRADIFFYYGTAKSEIGGALFEEIEVEPGLRDVWLRFNVPVELKGEWEIGCFAPEHYEKGMHSKVVFQ